MQPSEWQPSLPACSASVVSSCVRSVILTDERFLHFQLRLDKTTNDADGNDMPRCNHSLADRNYGTDVRYSFRNWRALFSKFDSDQQISI
jgi:hypothetical protein